MEDDRVSKRKKFYDPVVDLRPEREKFIVNLRKKNKQKLFMAKRRLQSFNIAGDGDKNKNSFSDEFHKAARDVVSNLYLENLTLHNEIDTVFTNLSIEDETKEFYLINIMFLRHKICDH